mgnify:FL=1
MFAGTMSVCKVLAWSMAVMLCWPVVVLQAAWPERPIRMVIPFPAGGATDFMARAMGGKLGERLGQPVVVDNRGGAGGAIAAEAAAQAAADGYTLFFATMGTLAINPALMPRLRYDPVKDFSPIALTHATANMLVLHPSVNARSVPELIALARARPGALSFGSAGNGSSSHLSGEMFKALAGVDLLHVPYKGTAPALTDLLAGRLSMMFDTASVYIEHVRAGKLRALGVTSAQRLAAVPEIPALAEAGLPGYDVSIWLGVLAPANTPREVVLRLNQELGRVMADSELRKQLADAGIEPRHGTPEAFAELIRNEIAKWARVVKASGAKAD